MQITRLLKKVLFSLLALVLRQYRRGYGISIIVPFHCTDANNQRAQNWRWLESYWRAQLPGAEIIVGRDPAAAADATIAFSKSVAVNEAAKKTTGDVLVVVDADGFIAAEHVLHCANEIRAARARGHRLWFVPYRQFYRLTAFASQCMLASGPATPFRFPTPPEKHYIQDTSNNNTGHWYGALIQIVPREAFDIVGGWDKRFRGWGGEDHAIMRATDTLYGPHKTLPVQVLHIWHPMIGPDGSADLVGGKLRMWGRQQVAGANDKLSGRYYYAQGNPARMRALVDEGIAASRPVQVPVPNKCHQKYSN